MASRLLAPSPVVRRAAVCGLLITAIRQARGSPGRAAIERCISQTLMRNFMNRANAEPFFDVWNASQARGAAPKPPPPPMSPTRIAPPVLPPLKDPMSTPPALGGSTAAAPPRGLYGSQPPLPLPRPGGGVAGAPYGSQPPLPLPTPGSGAVALAALAGMPPASSSTAAAAKPSVAAAPSTGASARTGAAAGTSAPGRVTPGQATTLDGGRSVLRYGAGVRPPLRPLPEASWSGRARDLEGTARAAVAPPPSGLESSCGRRTSTAWRWSAPRRA